MCWWTECDVRLTVCAPKKSICPYSEYNNSHLSKTICHNTAVAAVTVGLFTARIFHTQLAVSTIQAHTDHRPSRSRTWHPKTCPLQSRHSVEGRSNSWPSYSYGFTLFLDWRKYLNFHSLHSLAYTLYIFSAGKYLSRLTAQVTRNILLFHTKSHTENHILFTNTNKIALKLFTTLPS